MEQLREAIRALVQEVLGQLAGAQVPVREWVQVVQHEDGGVNYFPEKRLNYSITFPRDIGLLDSFEVFLRAIRETPGLAGKLSIFPTGQTISDPETLRISALDLFALPFLTAYVERSRSFAFQDEIFQSLSNNVAADLYATEISVVHLSPLSRTVITGSDFIEISEGLRLRRLASSEVEELVNSRWSQVGVLPQFTDLGQLRCAIEIKFKRAGINCWGEGTEQANELRDRALDALRLLTGGNVRFAFTIEKQESVIWTHHLTTAPIVAFQGRSSAFGSQTTVDGCLGPNFTSLVEQLLISPNRTRVALALRRYTTGLDRPEAADQLIDHWIALESLFTPDSQSEIRFRAALRIASFLGKDAAERQALFDDIRQSYDWRSTLVHGSDEGAMKKLERKAPLDATVEKTRTYLGKSLIKVLESNKTFQPGQIDARLLEGNLDIA